MGEKNISLTESVSGVKWLVNYWLAADSDWRKATYEAYYSGLSSIKESEEQHSYTCII